MKRFAVSANVCYLKKADKSKKTAQQKANEVVLSMLQVCCSPEWCLSSLVTMPRFKRLENVLYSSSNLYTRSSAMVPWVARNLDQKLFFEPCRFQTNKYNTGRH